MKKLSPSSLSMTVGMAISTSFAVGSVQGDTNPFKLAELPQSAFQLAGVVPFEQSKVAPTIKSNDAPAEMKCGAMMKDKPGEQISDMKSSGEMSCGAMMKNMSGKSSEEKKAMCMKMMTDKKEPHQ